MSLNQLVESETNMMPSRLGYNGKVPYDLRAQLEKKHYTKPEAVARNECDGDCGTDSGSGVCYCSDDC